MKSDYPRLQDVYTHEQLCEHFSLARPERQFVQTFRGTVNQQAIAILLKVLPHLSYPDFTNSPSDSAMFLLRAERTD